MDDDKSALEIFQYLLECEDRGIIEFSFTTRLNISILLLTEETPNIDLIEHYYNEMLAYSKIKGFYEHKFLLTKEIYEYYYKNADYNNAIKICKKWKDYCKENNYEFALFEEKKRYLSY